jgi:hypothetical protein
MQAERGQGKETRVEVVLEELGRWRGETKEEVRAVFLSNLLTHADAC